MSEKIPLRELHDNLHLDTKWITIGAVQHPQVVKRKDMMEDGRYFTWICPCVRVQECSLVYVLEGGQEEPHAYGVVEVVDELNGEFDQLKGTPQFLRCIMSQSLSTCDAN